MLKPHTINQQIITSIKDIEKLGMSSSPRGLSVKEIDCHTFQLDPCFTLADFPARPFNFKYFMGELSWYLSKDNHIEWINKFSSFWQSLANDAGTVNSNYGTLLFGEQLQWALDSLKKDENTRQAICFVNGPRFQYEGNKDFVCTMYINFWIRNNELHMKVQMRSNDIFYGLTYDAPFFAFLQQTMHYWLKETYPELILGKYIHSADNVHYYEKHYKLAQDIIKDETTSSGSFFLLRKPLFNITNNIYLITDEGRNFLTDVIELINCDLVITQAAAKETLLKYFYIQ